MHFIEVDEISSTSSIIRRLRRRLFVADVAIHRLRSRNIDAQTSINVKINSDFPRANCTKCEEINFSKIYLIPAANQAINRAFSARF